MIACTRVERAVAGCADASDCVSHEESAALMTAMHAKQTIAERVMAPVLRKADRSEESGVATLAQIAPRLDNPRMKSTRALCAALAALPTLLSAQLATPRPASRAPANDDWSGFVRLFDAYADSDRVVGASVLVMRDGRVLDRHDYG